MLRILRARVSRAAAAALVLGALGLAVAAPASADHGYRPRHFFSWWAPFPPPPPIPFFLPPPPVFVPRYRPYYDHGYYRPYHRWHDDDRYERRYHRGHHHDHDDDWD